MTTLKMAAANIRAFHEHQVHKNFVMNDTPGIVLGQKYTPIEKPVCMCRAVPPLTPAPY